MSTSDSESWEDFCSSGSEYLPENDRKKNRPALYFDATSETDFLITTTTSSNPRKQPYFGKEKRRLFPEIGESSKAVGGDLDTLSNQTVQQNNQSVPAVRDVAVKVLVPYSDTSSSSESESEKTPMKRQKKSRKRKRNPHKWKKNKRKENYQKGIQYINSKGVVKPAKQIDASKDCTESCRFKCKERLNDETRQEIKKSYYSLDQNGKHGFILNMTKKILVKRKRSSEANYKSFSFEYYFEKENEKVRVCKPFFLNTLCISQKPVYNVHLKKSDSGTPQQDTRGKNTKDRVTKRDKDAIRQHIESFPYVEAHYCRKDSKKNYLESTLNVQKMYELYVDLCNGKQMVPQKLCLYRHIFNFEYNLEFLLPKTDRCDTCEEYRLAKREGRADENIDISYDFHIGKKNIMRQERENDKKREDPNCSIVCFDLQNVINLPKSDVSVLFYKQKLNVYNLTAHSSIGKEIYCAIWPETMCGRSGNDIASALIQILGKIVSKHPEITEIITWSDSCVPQNRNSHISVAIADFLNRHPLIQMITMKYSIPGHSCIQVVDNVHSRIEKLLKVTDIWSPLSFVRLLLKVDRKRPFFVINMQTSHFMNYKKAALNFQYEKIPYTKVCQLRFSQGDQFGAQYKVNNHSEEFVRVNIKNTKFTVRRNRTIMEGSNSVAANFVIAPANDLKTKSMNKKKIEHVQFAYKWMPLEDQQYMNSLLSEFKKKK